MNGTWWNRLIKRAAASRPASYILARILRPVDLWMLRLTQGRRTLTQSLTGLETICVQTIGARTQQVRPIVLAAARIGERWILAATNFGSKRHPGWYYNLVHFPEVEISFEGAITKCRARLAQGEERKRCWSELVSTYAGFADYQVRAGNRQVPIFVLEPLTEPNAV